MPTTQSTLFPPPLRDSKLSGPEQQYLFTLQRLLSLRIGDTSAGPYSEALPPAGLNASTGQSNQNAEIVYIKGSADANDWTITGAATGAVVLSAQYDVARFKSNATNWYLSAKSGGGVAQVNSDWNAAAGVAAILNKPAIPGAPITAPAAVGQLAKFANPATTLTGADLTLDVTTAGSTAATVVGLQTKSISATTPIIGDVLRYNGTTWVPAPPFYVFWGTKASMISTGLVGIGCNTATNNGTISSISATATSPWMVRVTTPGTGSVNASGIEDSTGGTAGQCLGQLLKFVAKIRLDQTATGRCYIVWADPPAVLTGAVFSTDTPNRNYVGFRFSATTDLVGGVPHWKAVNGTSSANQTVQDTGVVVDTANAQAFEVRFDGTDLFYYIDGNLVASTANGTNVPATSTLMHQLAMVDNKNTNNADTISFAYFFSHHK